MELKYNGTNFVIVDDDDGNDIEVIVFVSDANRCHTCGELVKDGNKNGGSYWNDCWDCWHQEDDNGAICANYHDLIVHKKGKENKDYIFLSWEQVRGCAYRTPIQVEPELALDIRNKLAIATLPAIKTEGNCTWAIIQA